MSFNNISFGSRIEGETGLFFELIKEHYREEIYQYKTKKKQVINIKERGLYDQGSKISGILSLFIFITRYKIIDQLFEQILDDNGEKPSRYVWTYQEKINRIKKISSSAKFILPKLLKKDKNRLFNSYFNYYQKNKEARNAIVHRRIQITMCNEWVVEFVDFKSGLTYNIKVSIHELIGFYYQIRAITEDYPNFKVINRQVIMNEISSQVNQALDKSDLIKNLGEAYAEEIEHFLDYLIKNSELEMVGTKIQIKNKP